MNDSTQQDGYTLDILAGITGVSTQTIVQYQEHGLIRSQFDDETVRVLRRIEYLRETFEMNLGGLNCSRICSMSSSNCVKKDVRDVNQPGRAGGAWMFRF